MAAPARLRQRQHCVRTWRMHRLVRVDAEGPGQNLPHVAVPSVSFLHTHWSWGHCTAHPGCAFAAVGPATQDPCRLACCTATVGRWFDSRCDGVCLGNILLAWMGDRFSPQRPSWDL